MEVNKHQEIRGNPGVSKEDMEDESNTKKPVHCKECYGCNVPLSDHKTRASLKENRSKSSTKSERRRDFERKNFEERFSTLRRQRL